MKKTLLHTFSLFAALAAVFLFTANTAEARDYSYGATKYVSHYTTCGCPVYQTKTFRNHDRYGKPVYSYYTHPVSHRCKGCSQQHNKYQKKSNRHGASNNHYNKNTQYNNSYTRPKTYRR